jgi:hypothetical protein
MHLEPSDKNARRLFERAAAFSRHSSALSRLFRFRRVLTAFPPRRHTLTPVRVRALPYSPQTSRTSPRCGDRNKSDPLSTFSPHVTH